jgi:hypothetical protein
MQSPAELYALQEQFARVITSTVVATDERMRIYQQLYWCRLFRFFYEKYPFLTRLFGFSCMNEEILIPYLLRYRPDHWCMRTVGDRLMQWLEEAYHREDKRLVQDAASLDEIYEQLRVSEEKPFPLGGASEKLCLQPYVALATFDRNMIEMRDLFLEKSVAYWEEHSFPKIKREKLYLLIFRSRDDSVLCQKIDREEFKLLHAIKTGKSLEEIVELVELEDPQTREKLPMWLCDWARLGLLST